MHACTQLRTGVPAHSHCLKNRIGSILACVAFFICVRCVRCVFRFFVVRKKIDAIPLRASLRALRTAGSKPAFRQPSVTYVFTYTLSCVICKITIHISVNRFIWLEVKHNQNYYLKLDVSTSIRGLHQKKLVLSSSGS